MPLLFAFTNLVTYWVILVKSILLCLNLLPCTIALGAAQGYFVWYATVTPE